MNTKTFPRLALALAFLFTILAFVGAQAETTALVNYQGKLKKAGTNMNGEVTIIFKIFTGETNEVCVFEETQQVAVVDGLYSTLIGKNPSLGNIEDSAKLDDAFLEVTVNGTKLKPREKFCPPAFARKSEERWNLFVPGWWSFASSTFSINGTPLAILGYPLQNLGATNCSSGTGVGGLGIAVFPMPAHSVRVASANALITLNNTNDAFWLQPELNPGLGLRLTARTLSQSVRPLGPYLVITPTNIPPFNSWFSLPLSTNQTDLALQPSEFLCVEIGLGYPGNLPENCQVIAGAPHALLLDVRVR